jgi:hypothetical protein
MKTLKRAMRGYPQSTPFEAWGKTGHNRRPAPWIKQKKFSKSQASCVLSTVHAHALGIGGISRAGGHGDSEDIEPIPVRQHVERFTGLGNDEIIAFDGTAVERT